MAVTDDQKAAAVRADPEYLNTVRALGNERDRFRRDNEKAFNAQRERAHETYMKRCAEISEAEAAELARLNREFEAAKKRLHAKVQRRKFPR
jgi:hypothetical protein